MLPTRSSPPNQNRLSSITGRTVALGATGWLLQPQCMTRSQFFGLDGTDCQSPPGHQTTGEFPMAVRKFHVSFWPHLTNTTVTVVIEDIAGNKKVSGGVGQVTLPVGRGDFTG